MWDFRELASMTLFWSRIFFSMVVLCPFLEKRKNFGLRAALSTVTSYALVLTLFFLRLDLNDFTVLIALYFAFSIMAFSWLVVCFKAPLINVLFHYFSAIFLSVASSSLREVYLISAPIEKDGYADAVLSTVLTVIVYCAVYFLFVRSNASRYRNLEINKSILWLYFLNAIVMMGITFVANSISKTEIAAVAILNSCICVYCFILLMIQYIFLLKHHSDMKEAKERMERETIERISREAIKQYNLLKENMEIINIKCHDMRKQLESFKKHGQGYNEYIGELEQAVEAYDCTVETGNEALDVILSETTLRCRNNNIQLACLADGKALSFMAVPDVYSLFGNAVDNAVEYLVTLSEDKRFIRLNVKTTERFLLIHVENYFEGELEYENGLPGSVKHDKAYHGFGVSSIKRVAEKYGGSLQIDTSQSLFQLNICIPIKERER